MKRYIIPLAISSLFLLQGCNDLKLNESVYHSQTFQFSDFTQVKEVMTNVYGYLKPGFAAVENTMIDCASDDAYYVSPNNQIRKFYDGSWSPTNTIDDQWAYLYEAIRAANYLLENCPEDFPESKYNDDYSRNIVQLKNYPWEAKALRAYFHAELLKRYGKIIIADKTYTPEEVNTLKQKSYQEAAEWIAAELEEAAKHLPDTYSGTYFAEIGRVTKGFALAARARVLLYAASPLNNTENAAGLWEKAAAAADDFFLYNAKSHAYDLIDCSRNPNADNSSVIFCIRENASSSFESANFPIGYEGGNSGICPTFNLVSAFDMADGEPFDYFRHKDALLDPEKRDPRLRRFILSDGDEFKGSEIETFFGGKNGLPINNATSTGFYLKKFIIEDTEFSIGNVKSYPHNYPIYRVAEIYLNYAEALFEATGDMNFKGNLNGHDYTMSPAEALNKIRKVAGMPETVAKTADEFRERLRNERRVELCFEGHRFWDIRRWKVGKDTENIYGLAITKDGETKSAKREIIQNRKWEDKMYFYPLTDTERHKNTDLEQNPGWE